MEQVMITPDILVSLRFLTTAEGGRSQPTPSESLSPILEYGTEFFACRLLLQGIGSIAPGGTASVPIKLLRPDLVKGRMRVGERVRLRELATIAEGTIEQIYATL